MGRIPEDIINEIRDRADMLQVVGDYVQLKKAGANYKACCPFHSEKTPSFNVNPAQGFFKCFGCGEGGNIFTFLMKIEGWSFPEAVHHLAKRVGVDVPETSDEESEAARRKAQARALYQDILETARRWYERQLWQGEDPVGRDYLAERGIDEETARAFGLGYAPNAWTEVLSYLGTRKINAELVERAGLAIRGGRSGFYDRFRGRVMFPVIDIWGKTLAFGGRRVFDDDEKAGAKYINSPETRFYRKGSELYGLAATKQGIRSAGHAVLVEGNFDVIALHAQGIRNAVSPMGTALTERQVKLLSRYSKHVFVAFDGDDAGRAAVIKSLPALVRQGFDARVVEMPPGEDPDSFVRGRGMEAWERALGQARPIVAYALDEVMGRVEGAPIEVRVQALSEAGELLEHVTEEIAWRHYAQEVSRRLEIPLKQLGGYLKHPERLREQERRERQARRQQVAAAMGQDPAPRRPEARPEAPRRPEAGQEPQESARHDAPLPEFLSAPELRVQPKPLPIAEARLLQVLSDLPGRLVEFVDENGCRLLSDERLVVLIERVYAQHLETERPPEYARLAEEFSQEHGDPDLFSQVSALLCAERPYNDETIERTYSEIVITLQLGWLEQEERALLEIERSVVPGSQEEMDALIRRQETIKLRRELDLQYQRKRQRATG